jgi:hypothetical protein
MGKDSRKTHGRMNQVHRMPTVVRPHLRGHVALLIAAAAAVPSLAAPTSQPAAAPGGSTRGAPAPSSRPAAARAAPTSRPIQAAAAIPASRPAAPAAGQTAQPGRAAPDLSSPQSTARSYADVVLGGDPKLIRVVTTGEEGSMLQAEAAAGHAAALYDFAAAMAEKFGDDGRRYAPDSAKSDRAHFFELLGKARLTIAADTASYFEPTSGFRLALRKGPAGWQVELPKPVGSKEDPDIVSRAVESLNGQAALLRETAAEVRAGRYKSVQEVDKARRDKDRRLQKQILKIKTP